MAARIALLPQDSRMSLRNMNIAPRAFLGFAFIGALMLFLGVFALNQMSKIRGATEDITMSSVPSIRALDEFTQLTLRLRVLSYRLLTNREPEVQQKTLEAFEVRNQQIRTAQGIYEKLIESSEERAAYDDYVRLLGQYHQIEERMKSLSRANQVEELRSLLNNELLSNSEQVNAVLTRLLDINNKMALATNKDAEDQYNMAFNMVVSLLVIATLLLDLLRHQMPNAELASFEFRAVRPTFDIHHFFVNGAPSADGKTIHLWAEDHEGWLTMDATAVLK